MSHLLAQAAHIAVPRIKPGSANPARKLATLIAGMYAGADSGVTETCCGSSSSGHARQLESALGAQLALPELSRALRSGLAALVSRERVGVGDGDAGWR
jgi:hypothetical protein